MKYDLKKIKHLFGMAALFAVFCCSVTCFMACEDKDSIPEGDEEKEEGLLVLEAMYCNIIIHALCNVDSLPDGTVAYDVINGVVLDNSRPDVYYIGYETALEAESFFYQNCVPIGEEENVYKENESLVYSLGEYGQLKYTSGDGETELATITVDIPQLSGLHKIVFIPISMWPDNAYYSPFSPGDVMTKDGKWWICVRACQGGTAGILMTFDEGWEIQERSDHFKDYKKYTGCASQEAWNGLAQLIFDDKEGFRKQCEELRKEEMECSKAMLTFFDRVFSNAEITCQAGSMWDNKYTWWFWKVWEGSTDYIIFPKFTKNRIGMTVFSSGNHYFKRNWNPKVPSFRNSYSITFTHNDKKKLEEEYTIKYPEY